MSMFCINLQAEVEKFILKYKHDFWFDYAAWYYVL